MIVIYYGVRPRVTGQSPCADAVSEDGFLKQLWQLGLCRAVASVPAMSSSQTLSVILPSPRTKESILALILFRSLAIEGEH